MLAPVLHCLMTTALALDILPGFETSRFGLGFNLCPPPQPAKIVYLPAPCRFDAENEEIRLALARLDANMGQKEVSPAVDPVKTNALGGGTYNSPTGSSAPNAKWSLW